MNIFGKKETEQLDKEGKIVLEAFSPEDTACLGQRLGEMCVPGQVYTLIGDLGVGKTVFTQGFAKGLGIREPVNSPTFTIVQVYEEGRLPLYHFDVYRIDDIDEMDEIGYEDYFFGCGVCLVEWSSRIKELIPSDAVEIVLEKDLEKGFDFRRITVSEP